MKGCMRRRESEGVHEKEWRVKECTRREWRVKGCMRRRESEGVHEEEGE